MDFIFALPAQTFSVDAYCERIARQELPTSLTIRFTIYQRMVYYLFWTAYSTKVDEREFESFFGVSLKKVYGFELWLMKRLGFVTEENGVYAMTLKGLFIIIILKIIIRWRILIRCGESCAKRHFRKRLCCSVRWSKKSWVGIEKYKNLLYNG